MLQDEIIFWIILGSVILLSIGCLVYLYFKIKEHRKHYSEQKQFAESNILSSGLCLSFCWVLQRNYVHYYSYATQMVLNLLCNTSSLLLSIGTFSSIATVNNSSNTTLIMSFLAIAILIISLFLKPGKRAQQYIAVWRNTNRDIMKVFELLGSSEDTKNEDYIKEAIITAVNNRCEIEFSLSADED